MSAQLERQGDVPQHPAPGEQVGILKDKRDACRIDAGDGAGGGAIQLRDDSQEGRFAASARPDHRQELAGVDVEVHGADGFDAALENARHAAELDGAGSTEGRGGGRIHVAEGM
jgi:hypothetical protein